MGILPLRSPTFEPSEWRRQDARPGGETNYVLATVGLYVSIFNLFTSLLRAVFALSSDTLTL